MKELWKYLIIGCSVIISVIVLSFAITYYGRSKDTIAVTGLGETTFTSDMIVWSGMITADNYDKLAGYKQIENDRNTVLKYLKNNGISEDEVTFAFINSTTRFTSVYNDEGKYTGDRFIGYRFTQDFTITSNDVEKVERISREISSLISQNIDIDSYTPEYYYTKLDDLKLELIEKASRDARLRAEKIVENAGAHLGKASNARLGVFQITAVNGDEDYSYGGTFNTSSKEKKARITVRMEYKLR
ncbi:MAG: SIMPL domain-containing protein [Paludibacteraceae bacterium]|nr:SIMPL domain-containing protein [Paludibacteraceae bacterium]